MKFKDLDIVYENAEFIAINKPAGIFSVPSRAGIEPSLKEIIELKFEKIFIVHRLDKETSGIILFAKNATAHKQLSEMFEHRKISKYYVGLVVGSLYNQTGSIDIGIAEHPAIKGQMITTAKGKNSLTTYEVLNDYKQYSWVKFQIHTGRMHQIRVHCKHIGNPIACDALYGDGKPVFISTIKKHYKISKTELDEKPILSRVALHAYQLNFLWNDKDIELIAEPTKRYKSFTATIKQK
jgi:23S rRNA pseudouridine1911/1915/1917 synthase